MSSVTPAIILALVLALAPIPAAAQTQTPEQFFGFTLGTDGELARYPKVVEYLQHLAKTTDRVKFEFLGKTTMGNDYVLAIFSSPQNLAKLDRLTQINHRLADPRGLSEQEAQALVNEGRPFYFLYATIHSTEVGNGQAINIVAHRLATDNSPATREILDNSVVLLVPSQNPDGQHLVIDHWYKTKGTNLNRVYPDLYHKYVGHDDNRDWFMFTQIETRLNLGVQSRFKPQISHDMHQQGAGNSRIFVPPFEDPFDENIHPILRIGQATVGQAMAQALIAEGKEGVAWKEGYDMWTPARQYMVYHGQPRILTEIASVNLADPYVNPAGKDKPLGPQEPRWNFPVPYTKSEWRLSQIVDYGVTVAWAGIQHVAKYRTTWMENFYKVHRDWVNWKGAPYAFIVPATQRDPMATREMLDILKLGEVELHRATAPFTANGKQYGAGSVVVKLAQPYGAFAKTMLEKQVYPDLRIFPGGPPESPYDVTAHTLWMLMGVEVDQVAQPFDATLELVKTVTPASSAMPTRPKYAYLVGPESNAGFKALAELQKASIPVYRAARSFDSGGKSFAAGTWMIAPTPAAAKILETVARDTGVQVFGIDRAPAGVDGFRIKPATRIGLYRGANNMPGGWLMWLFEQYGFNFQVVTAQDFEGDLSAKYDTIVMPSGLSKERIVTGLDPKRNGPEFAWAYGVGDAGWKKLADFVNDGGTIVAIGSATETARELLDLPIEKALPEAPPRRFGGGQATGAATKTVPAAEIDRQLKDAFTSPARLMQTLRDRVADPESLFYCPGSLLLNEFDTTHPVAFGMPASWPVFFESDQAYRLRPGFDVDAQVVSRYPRENILQSGWLLGEEYLRDQANIVSFAVGRGTAVTLGSQIDYRTQPRGTLKLLFNAIFHGPSSEVTATQLQRLGSGSTN